MKLQRPALQKHKGIKGIMLASVTQQNNLRGKKTSLYYCANFRRISKKCKEQNFPKTELTEVLSLEEKKNKNKEKRLKN